MTDEKQARLEARARIDIRKLYEKGEITLKDQVFGSITCRTLR
jgi:hypothetical protein